jgi:hypothetical protein
MQAGATGWVGRLRRRWGVSTGQVFVILLVFACTGFTVMFLKRPVVALLAGEGEQSLLLGVAYYVLVLPLYNAILLAYGTLFGQFRFFWDFERRAVARLLSVRRRAPGPAVSAADR